MEEREKELERERDGAGETERERERAGERERERERERRERERERDRNIHLPTEGSIQRQDMSHTAGRVPTDPTTLSCSWDNWSGGGRLILWRMTRTCA